MTFTATYQFNGNTHSVVASSTDESGRRCALKFNPGGDMETEMVKLAFAGAMQVLIDIRNHTVKLDETASAEARNGYNDKMRLIATALTELEKGQMLGVKAVHAEKNAR